MNQSERRDLQIARWSVGVLHTGYANQWTWPTRETVPKRQYPEGVEPSAKWQSGGKATAVVQPAWAGSLARDAQWLWPADTLYRQTGLSQPVTQHRMLYCYRTDFPKMKETVSQNWQWKILHGRTQINVDESVKRLH